VFGAGGLGHVAGGLRPPLASPAPTSLACPHRPHLPPPASPAPIGLVCPHGEEEGSALVLGIGLRLWQSALGFPSLSLIYKSIVFPSLWIDRQFIIFSSSHHLLVSTGYEPGAELNSTPTISICYCLSSAPVPVDRANIS